VNYTLLTATCHNKIDGVIVKSDMSKNAFTLIELLIVVAIISILAAIAVPNFLEAQTRAKISRAKSDMRTEAIAIEAYCVDWNSYPKGNYFQLAYPLPSHPHGYGERALASLTTPLAYLSSLPEDPFNVVGACTYDYRIHSRKTFDDPIQAPIMQHHYYSAFDSKRMVGLKSEDYYSNGVVSWYVLQNCGPIGFRYTLGSNVLKTMPEDAQGTRSIVYRLYDPTNGTVSFGAIYRIGGTPEGLNAIGANWLHKRE